MTTQFNLFPTEDAGQSTESQSVLVSGSTFESTSQEPFGTSLEIDKGSTISFGLTSTVENGLSFNDKRWNSVASNYTELYTKNSVDGETNLPMTITNVQTSLITNDDGAGSGWIENTLSGKQESRIIGGRVRWVTALSKCFAGRAIALNVVAGTIGCVPIVPGPEENSNTQMFGIALRTTEAGETCPLAISGIVPMIVGAAFVGAPGATVAVVTDGVFGSGCGTITPAVSDTALAGIAIVDSGVVYNPGDVMSVYMAPAYEVF